MTVKASRWKYGSSRHVPSPLKVCSDRRAFAKRLIPISAAVLPLIPRNEDMTSKARALYEDLRRALVAEYDDSGQIGRRYRRQDEIGTPWALTVDEQTLEDDTVTIRDRDSLAQERIQIEGARAYLLDRLAQDWTTPKAE